MCLEIIGLTTVVDTVKWILSCCRTYCLTAATMARTKPTARKSTGGKAPRKQLATKVFNDPIHGHIELHPLCVKIIDTPQFQRLRFIKQLGVSYFVYPGASHNRFEHSIGVCHLAGRLVSRIKENQPELKITKKDVLCVQIAGLCHDLGHGPFSHVFDNKFIPAVRPGSTWKHEEASVEMFKYLVSENQLKEEFKRNGLTRKDQDFITEQIKGVGKQKRWTLKGRPKEKSYLYEVVANKRNGIDVDKWDYFARDCHHLGIKNNFDHNRCINFARVIKAEGEWQICTRDKEVVSIYDMFYTRTNLHRRAYQHKTTNIIEYMIVEALVLANNHIKFRGKDRKMMTMSEAIYDMTAFSQLTDEVFSRILLLDSKIPKLRRSKEIIHNILTRKLYKCVGEIQPGEPRKEEDKPKIITEVFSKLAPSEKQSMKKEDIVILFVNHDYGMKENNPVDKVRFYCKKERDVAVRILQESSMLPRNFNEQVIRIYSKNQSYCDMLERAFKEWCKDNKISPQKFVRVGKRKLPKGSTTSLPAKRLKK
ncbi:deoxynucleoside triphosphate triphosphohydrolase SAMHD1-like isoform X2 [Dreissena polymorpha]|uniref:deoxynucleoside triphosphate triphosphohydrolase SAMHD1-like isoform X2 n=1 Tax=Dreissena polymorpha TaxID=45954 RepID=UPI002264F581|nr:deoxynucleoside triphosphate triphosphohydrolase SAMHD1-like isoform X2 [Dreissena polymorpha]